jgi:hypothetical protein
MLGISVHVVDLARGAAAYAGPITVHRIADDRTRGPGDRPPALQDTAVCRLHEADPAEPVHPPVRLSPWRPSVRRGR